MSGSSASTRLHGTVAIALTVLSCTFATSACGASEEEERAAARENEQLFDLELQAADVEPSASVTLVAYRLCETEADEEVAMRQGIVNALTNLDYEEPESGADVVIAAAHAHLCDS